MRARLLQSDYIYPYFELTNENSSIGIHVNIPESKVKWIQNTLKNFHKIQDYMYAVQQKQECEFEPKVIRRACN
jgi:hypothetical protein